MIKQTTDFTFSIYGLRVWTLRPFMEKYRSYTIPSFEDGNTHYSVEISFVTPRWPENFDKSKGLML